VYYIGAGESELHRRVRGYANATRHKIILSGDDPHGDGPVWLGGSTEIALNKLALEMEGQRVDDLNVAGRVQRADDAGRNVTAIITTSIVTMTISQCFSVRATTCAGTMPSGSGRLSGFDDGSANRASRHKQEDANSSSQRIIE
jgi:hypothetical protein